MIDQKRRDKTGRASRRPGTPPAEAAGLREAIEQFYFAYREFTAGPDRILEQRGLGRVHHRVLYFVGRHPGLAVHALLALLAVSKQALHRPLRDLAEAGLVELRTDPADRRVRQLWLSKEGSALEAALTGTQMRLLAEVFGATGGSAEAGWRQVMAVLSRPPGPDLLAR